MRLLAFEMIGSIIGSKMRSIEPPAMKDQRFAEMVCTDPRPNRNTEKSGSMEVFVFLFVKLALKSVMQRQSGMVS